VLPYVGTALLAVPRLTQRRLPNQRMKLPARGGRFGAERIFLVCGCHRLQLIRDSLAAESRGIQRLFP